MAADTLGISAAVAALNAAATKSSIVCRSLLTTHADAPRSLSAINIDTSVVKSTLSHVYGILSLNRAGLDATLRHGSPLANAFDVALTGATLTLGRLDDALQKLSNNTFRDGSIAWQDSMGRLWDQDTMSVLQADLKIIRAALAVLFEAVEIENLAAMQYLLHDRSSVFDAVRRGPLATLGKPSLTSLPAEEPFSIFTSAEEDASPFEAPLTQSDVGERVLHQLRVVGRVNRWDGSGFDDSDGTPSLGTSEAGDPITDSSGPSTPPSSIAPRRDFDFPAPKHTSWISGRKRNSQASDDMAAQPKAELKQQGLISIANVHQNLGCELPPRKSSSNLSTANRDALLVAAATRPALTPIPPPKSPRRKSMVDLRATLDSESAPPVPELPPISPRRVVSQLIIPTTSTITNYTDAPRLRPSKSSSTLFTRFLEPKPTPPPAYTFSIGQNQPSKTRSSFFSFFRRKTARKASTPYSSAVTATTAHPGAFSIEWLNPPSNTTFQRPARTTKTIKSASNPTSLTIPLIGDISVTSKSASKRWIAAQRGAAGLSNAPPTEDLSISGNASDGHSTRAVTANFYSIDKREQLEVLTGVDIPLAVLCYNVADPATLDNLTRKWLPLLLTIHPTTPILLVAFNPTPSASTSKIHCPDRSSRYLSRETFSASYHSSDASPSGSDTVPRHVGLTVARQIGAEAYIECFEADMGALARLFGVVVGYGAVLSEERARGTGRGYGVAV